MPSLMGSHCPPLLGMTPWLPELPGGPTVFPNMVPHSLSPPVIGPIALLACPLECGSGPWQSPSSLFVHVNHHLQEMQDVSVLAGWATSAKRWICSSCHLLCVQRRPCGTCRRPYTEGGRPLEGHRIPVSLVVEDWDESIWHSLLLQPQPVIRAIPLGGRSVWLQGLANELDYLRRAATATAVHRFAAF